jgi:hypothetical protein
MDDPMKDEKLKEIAELLRAANEMQADLPEPAPMSAEDWQRQKDAIEARSFQIIKDLYKPTEH